MPARGKSHLFDYLDYPTYQILSALKSSCKGFTELSRYCSLSVPNFNNRLTTMIKLGLVEEKLQVTDRGRKKKVYAITEKGRKILELLEEIERIFREIG